MIDFSKKSETIKYFNSIMADIKHVKIQSIFSFYSLFWNHHRGFRTYSTDTDIYILFENGYCLVISYRFIDALDVQLRKLTLPEKEEYQNLLMKDVFHAVNDIYDCCTERIDRTECCDLEYGSIVNVALRSVTKDYNKWIDDDIVWVSPSYETFDEIKFTMSNGKSFVICADDADMDGYVRLWSEDTNETITVR